MIIHHSGKDKNKGARGHSSLRAAVDTEIEIKVDGQIRTARCRKQRDLENGKAIAFALQRVELGLDDECDLITSCVVEHLDIDVALLKSSRKLTRNQEIAMQALHDAVAKHGTDFGRNPSGTGAFKFGEWRSNEAVVVEANSSHWEGAPKLQAVVFRPITDANTRTAEMLAGGIDMMVEVPPVALSKFQGDGYTVHEQAGPHVWFLILNAKEGPFSDVRVRQAANYAINKEAIVNDVLEGTAAVAAGPTPPAFAWAYNNSLEPYPYNPEKARQLISEAGADGAELTFFVTEGGSGMLDPVAMGTAIQADLQAVGLKVNIETYEWNTFLGEVNPGLEGKADMAEMAWMTNDPDTLPFLALRTEAWPDKGGFNSGYYSNPKVDELLEAARASTDQSERARLYQEMQTIVQEDAPWVFVANWKQNAVTSDRVGSFSLQPSFFLLLNNVDKN